MEGPSKVMMSQRERREKAKKKKASDRFDLVQTLRLVDERLSPSSLSRYLLFLPASFSH